MNSLFSCRSIVSVLRNQSGTRRPKETHHDIRLRPKRGSIIVTRADDVNGLHHEGENVIMLLSLYVGPTDVDNGGMDETESPGGRRVRLRVVERVSVDAVTELILMRIVTCQEQIGCRC